MNTDFSILSDPICVMKCSIPGFFAIHIYSGLPNESTALMRVLPCKKSEIAKSTAFQNDCLKEKQIRLRMRLKYYS